MTVKNGVYLIGTPNAAGKINDQDVSIAPDTSTSGTNGLQLVDYRYSSDLTTTVFGKFPSNSGAHINIFVYPFPGDAGTRHLEAVLSVGSSSYTTATESFSEVLNGPFWGIEAVKVCATASGSAIAIAYI